MGPLKGRKVELVGAGDYLTHGRNADRAPIDLATTEIQTLAYEGCRSKTGFDSMMVTVSVMTFAGIGVTVHKVGLYKGTQGTLAALGFDMTTGGDWKKLVVHTGTMKTMPGFTALSGTFLHTVNTEAGWSGSPLYKIDSPGSASQIAGMHICAVPGLAAFNAAVSAPQLELLLRSPENEFAVTYNCPFQDIVVHVQDDADEGVFFLSFLNGDEKSTSKKIATDKKRQERAVRRKARGKQHGAPKQNVRKGGKLGGWKQRKGGTKRKGGGVKSNQLSPATYDKLKQASSIFAAKDPRAMGYQD